MINTWPLLLTYIRLGYHKIFFICVMYDYEVDSWLCSVDNCSSSRQTCRTQRVFQTELNNFLFLIRVKICRFFILMLSNLSEVLFLFE